MKTVVIYNERPQIAQSLDKAMDLTVQEQDEKEEGDQQQVEGEGDQEKAEGEEKPEGEGDESENDQDLGYDDDPLAGLEERLAKLDLDDQSKKIITDKLNEFNTKIKQTVEEREKALEVKLTAPPEKKKR